MKKYNIGDRFYLKRDSHGLIADEMVIITNVRRKGRLKYVDVKNIRGNETTNISVKILRKRPRHF